MRCRKARWFQSAQCDDTLSEKQRRELVAHLEECPSCRREAFYFSEIKGQTAQLDRVRARADFNLLLKTKVNAWEAEQERLHSARPSIFSIILGYPARLADLLSSTGNVIFGQRRFALVGAVSILLIAVIWTGYRAENNVIENDPAFTQDFQGFSDWESAGDLYLAGLTESGTQNHTYLVSGVSIVDEISLRTQPNYVMPTVPAEEVNAQVIF